MSSLPRPDRDPRRSSAGESAGMVRALTKQAAARVDAQQLDDKSEAARRERGESLTYRWVLEDDREADVRIEYCLHERPEILGIELIALDGEPPDLQERLELETTFRQAMDDAGDLWERVASYVWER